MRVILKRTWFVGGNRYRSVGKAPVEVPDKFRQSAPHDAIICDEVVHSDAAVPKEGDPAVVPKEDDKDNSDEKYVNPAHDLDPDRAFSEAFSKVNEEAKTEVDTFRDNLKKIEKKGK